MNSTTLALDISKVFKQHYPYHYQMFVVYIYEDIFILQFNFIEERFCL